MPAITFQPFDGYPIRPGLRRGESLAGYVYRFLASNGYRLRTDQDDVLIRIFSKNPKTVDKYFTRLQVALNEMRPVSLDHWQARLKRNQRCIEKWGVLAKVQLGFCPRCIKYNPCHLSLWELPLVKACPEHGGSLLTACDNCQRSFTWRGFMQGFVCGCGRPIAEMAVEEAETKWLNLARKIASASDVAVPYGMDRHVSPLFALRGFKLQDIYDNTQEDLSFKSTLRQDVPPVLLPSTRRLAREAGLKLDFNTIDYKSFLCD